MDVMQQEGDQGCTQHDIRLKTFPNTPSTNPVTIPVILEAFHGLFQALIRKKSQTVPIIKRFFRSGILDLSSYPLDIHISLSRAEAEFRIRTRSDGG